MMFKNIYKVSKAQTGFEPATFCLQDRCSTTKLLSRMKVSKKVVTIRDW